MYEEFMKFLKGYKTGEVLAQEGEETDEFFCLLQGKVGIWKSSTSEEKKEDYLIGEIKEKGLYFGEMSALINEPRTATIKAITPVKVLRFPGSMLPQMMLKQPKLGLKLATSLAERLKGTTNKQQNLTLKRDELQQDSTEQILYAKESFEKLFIMLSGVQVQYQFQPLKSILKVMGENKILRSGRSNVELEEEFLSTLPKELAETVRTFQSANKVSGKK